MTQQGQGLDRLTESHVVGQDATQPVLPQERQPGEPVSLVRAQAGVERGRWSHRRDRTGREQTLHLPLPGGRLVVDHAELG